MRFSWYRMGTWGVLGAFCALVCLFVPLFCYLTLTAFVGFFLTAAWKGKGFVLGLIALAIISIATTPKELGLWTLALSAAIGLSWLVELLSDQELSSDIQEREEREAELLEELEKRKEEVLSYRSKEKAFQIALEDAQNQLLKWKNYTPVSAVVPQEEAAEPVSLSYDLAQLRAQFEEKSERLSETRKELFLKDNRCSVLEKEIEEMRCDSGEEIWLLTKALGVVEGERQDLEAQVATLQEWVTNLSTPKKRATPKRKKKAASDEELPLLIQDKIDQISIPAKE
ncbi:MAG: hypothetical protein JSS61_01500 [Verrucomicrobia bacterium]|nr:hypothetical protein [Verrucomicrobiota bacterium]